MSSGIADSNKENISVVNGNPTMSTSVDDSDQGF